MTDATWQGDACSLVDEFRKGTRSPIEEVEATFAAIEASDLNAFSFLDRAGAVAAAATADTSKPFGGLPIGVKELDMVEGWPHTEASLMFKDRIASETHTVVDRFIKDGGAIPVGLTATSEFGGLNVSVTKLNGVTHNPWKQGHTCGGSSGGSGSAVAGGLVPMATGGDGGGSIRIPAGYNGLLGMKGTFGRLPRGPHAYIRPNTVVYGTLARSVRDSARHYDVTNGYDSMDPTSLPRVEGWEKNLGNYDLKGKTVMVDVDLGGVKLEPGVGELIESQAEALIKETGMVRVEGELNTPALTAQWMMGNLATLLADMGDLWSTKAHLLTDEIAIGMRLSQAFYNLHTAAEAERLRLQAQEAVGTVFQNVDFVIGATNPGPAFKAEATTSTDNNAFIGWAQTSPIAKGVFRSAMFSIDVLSSVFQNVPTAILTEATKKFSDVMDMGRLTIISNLVGNPAVSIPCGQIDGLPIGMQVLAPHHQDALLFDIALTAERTNPWPLTAPAAAANAAASATATALPEA